MRIQWIILFLLPLVVLGQKAQRLQPGKMYDAGETLFAPRFGFIGVVPADWSGVLPRESEVFLLTSLTMPAEIYVFGNEQADLVSMKKFWEKGVDLSADVHLSTKNAIIQNGLLMSEVLAKGPYINKSNRGYAVAGCGPRGNCIICLAVMPAAQFDAVKKVVDSFIANAKFEPPSSTSLYDDFDWKQFLTGKMLTTYIFKDEGSKESTIDLCADGTFKASVKKKGIFKNMNPQYKGTLTGNWTAKGIGEKGELELVFKSNLAPVKATLFIKEEQIFGNGERYFVAESEKCKK